MSDKHLEQYMKHTVVLRQWFVAYGVAALALLVAQEDFFEETNLKLSFFGLIATGVLLQIILVFINKTINWYIYYGSINSTFQKKWLCKICETIGEQFWIDVLVDLFTVFLYIGACIVFFIALMSR